MLQNDLSVSYYDHVYRPTSAVTSHLRPRSRPHAGCEAELSVGPITSTHPNPMHRKVKTLDPKPTQTTTQPNSIQLTTDLQYKEDTFRRITDCQ